MAVISGVVLKEGRSFEAQRSLMDGMFVDLYSEATTPVAGTDKEYKKLDASTYELQLASMQAMCAWLYEDLGSGTLAEAQAAMALLHGETFGLSIARWNAHFKALIALANADES